MNLVEIVISFHGCLISLTFAMNQFPYVVCRYPLDVVRRRMQLAGAVSDGYKYR